MLKMMFSYLTSLLLGLLLFSTAIESRTDETLELKFNNRNFLVSSSVMCAMLKKADLENNGYQKKVMSNVVEEPGSNMSNFQTVYFYYKPVKCSCKTMEDIEQELNTSLPGSNATRDVHWCVTVDYQQIVNSNTANQIHGFATDYGVIGKDMPIKLREEMKFRHLNNEGLQCKIGLEVNFQESLGCGMRRRKRQSTTTTTTITTTTTSGGTTTTTTTTTTTVTVSHRLRQAQSEEVPS